ncbi:MAG: DUF3108 domain-containing protein [Opitutae bacterium]|nr:DUF3108 domain-containing protein [Opitutae bacterium]
MPFASAAPLTAFRDGEVFTYKVGFAIFAHAGDLTIAAHLDQGGGRDLVRITTDTRSNGIVRDFYEFDNKAEVVIDRPTSRLQSVRESGGDPKRPTDTEFVVDYARHTARFTDRVRPERSGELALPDGDPIDLISALVQTRTWNLKPGEKRDVVVQFGRDFYPLAIYADHYETVRTPLGKYQTLVLVPRMEKDPKGVFKKGGQIKVWISQGETNLPVKMQLKLKFGAATLLLSGYEGGTKK